MKLLLRIIYLAITIISFSLITQAQDKKDKYDVELHGYVKNDFFYDTRQTISAREGHLLLWPAPPSFDANSQDINAHGSFNFLAIQTRLKVLATAPDVFNAKTSGFIEGEFFGHSNKDVNGFRLRHAIIKLDWTKSVLLTGQYWHPMFILECFPGTVSFNTGMGYVPFARNPQIRYSIVINNFKISATAYSELDFKSRDRYGVPNSKYIRDAQIPGLNLHLNYSNKNLKTGFTVNYHTILPERTTDLGYITNQKVKSLSSVGYINVKVKGFQVKLAATYCENPSGINMIGGYSILDTLNFNTNEVSYIPSRCVASWIDISQQIKKFRLGVFAGYDKNIGASKIVQTAPGGLGTNIGYLYRISPRMYYKTGNVEIGAEIEHSVAAFGDGTYSNMGLPQNVKEYANTRFIVGIFYHF